MNPTFKKFATVVDRLVVDDSEKSSFDTIDEFKAHYKINEISDFLKDLKKYLEENDFNFKFKELSLFEGIEVTKEDVTILVDAALEFLTGADQIFEDEAKIKYYTDKLGHSLIKDLPLDISYWTNVKTEDVQLLLEKYIIQKNVVIIEEIKTIYKCLSTIVDKHQLLKDELEAIKTKISNS